MKLHLCFTIFISLFVLVNCESRLTVQRVIQKSYGKQIDFNLPMQYVLEDTTLDVKGKPELPPIKVVVYINEQLCVPCFGNYLSAATKFISNFSSDSVQYICVMYPRPVEDIQEVMDSIKLSKTHIFYDKNNEYLKKNSLEAYTDMFQAFLLDKYNRVVLVGDPLRSTDLQKLYTEKIREMIANGGEFPKTKSILKKKQ